MCLADSNPIDRWANTRPDRCANDHPDRTAVHSFDHRPHICTDVFTNCQNDTFTGQCAYR
jgi:hypothetical protein